MKTIPIKILNPFDDTSVEFCAPHQTTKQAIEARADLDFGGWVSLEHFDVYDSGGTSFHRKVYVIMLESRFTSDFSSLSAVVLTGLIRSL